MQKIAYLGQCLAKKCGKLVPLTDEVGSLPPRMICKALIMVDINSNCLSPEGTKKFEDLADIGQTLRLCNQRAVE